MKKHLTAQVKKPAPLSINRSSVINFIDTHWLAVLLIIAGTWLRFHDLPNKAILFPDAGRDLLIAARAVEAHELPLQGIPSSVPRFKQGPLSIWLNMVIFQFSEYDLTLYSLIYALIGVLAMIGIYETCIVYFSRRAGTVALALLAFSPLAIAHSRMPYHTTFIPLFTIFYWWGLQALLTKQSRGVFWAIFTGCLLFQFELSLFPLLLAIPIILYLQKRSLKINSLEIGAGLLLGLLPQWIFDLTHRTSQLGMFGAWVGYRVASLFIPGEHTIGANKLLNILTSFGTYLPRMWGVDVGWNNILLMGILLLALMQFWQKTKPKLLSADGLLLLLTGLITAGYMAHGAPSEAYFPIYFIMLPLVIGVGLTKLPLPIQSWTLPIIIILGLVNVHTVMRHNFFVSNSQSLSYGPGYGEQLLIATALLDFNKPEIMIAGPTAQPFFPTNFSHLQWALYAKSAQTFKSPPQLIATTEQSGVIRIVPSRDSNLDFIGFHGITYQRKHFLSQTLIWPTTNRYVKSK